MITLKEFLEENEVTAFDYVENTIIINAVVGEVAYGIDIDTSDIESGTEVKQTSVFVIDGDILSVNNLELNIATINML